uniref:Uncharacterized protein n=1 Tax=Octopus bimaculoides TaxID=37653 RepID=A0A0L8HUS5_OCTBM
MRQYSIPSKIINIVKLNYKDGECAVLDDGEMAERFQVKTGQFERDTKIKLYKTLVRPALLYGCETWKMNNSDERKLDSFQYKGPRKVMQIGWPNIISMDELNKIMQVPKISQEVKRKR